MSKKRKTDERRGRKNLTLFVNLDWWPGDFLPSLFLRLSFCDSAQASFLTWNERRLSWLEANGRRVGEKNLSGGGGKLTVKATGSVSADKSHLNWIDLENNAREKKLDLLADGKSSSSSYWCVLPFAPLSSTFWKLSRKNLVGEDKSGGLFQLWIYKPSRAWNR